MSFLRRCRLRIRSDGQQFYNNNIYCRIFWVLIRFMLVTAVLVDFFYHAYFITTLSYLRVIFYTVFRYNNVFKIHLFKCRVHFTWIFLYKQKHFPNVLLLAIRYTLKYKSWNNHGNNFQSFIVYLIQCDKIVI